MADDERYLVIDGRRWRASDPGIPDPLRSELVGELMAARRAVKASGDDDRSVAAARRRVNDAKVALGERGHPWWEPPTDRSQVERIEAAARSLLRRRSADATICPSDVARVVASPEWRAALGAVRAIAARLVGDGQLVVLQRGVPVADPGAARGPLRYGRGTDFPDPPA